jgi:hypothetical protein
MNALAIKAAPLPIRYDAAVQALAVCERIDECKEWADRAAALESYYRQSSNVEMEQSARRIRLRAKRRVGELLLKIEGPAPRSAKGFIQAGAQTPRGRAARVAGLSKIQSRAAVRIARIPKEIAEAAIEATPPASETQLLRIAPTDPRFNGHTFCGSASYTKLVREVNGLAMFSYWCQKNPASELSQALNSEERSRCLKHVAEIRRWLGDFTQPAS